MHALVRGKESRSCPHTRPSLIFGTPVGREGGAEFLSRTKLKAGQEGVGGGYSTAPPMVLRAPRRCPALTHVIGTSRREGGGAQRVCRAARRYGGTTCCYASLTRSPVLTGRVLQPDPGTVGRTGEGGTEHPGSISALSLRHACKTLLEGVKKGLDMAGSAELGTALCAARS
eukprot:2606261-Rhodomonas_salina.1